MAAGMSPPIISKMRPELLQELAAHLLAQPEQRWLEFKDNNQDPERIGKYISALSNSAALEEMSFGYLVWGIEVLPAIRLEQASIQQQAGRAINR